MFLFDDIPKWKWALWLILHALLFPILWPWALYHERKQRKECSKLSPPPTQAEVDEMMIQWAEEQNDRESDLYSI